MALKLFKIQSGFKLIDIKKNKMIDPESLRMIGFMAIKAYKDWSENKQKEKIREKLSSIRSKIKVSGDGYEIIQNPVGL